MYGHELNFICANDWAVCSSAPLFQPLLIAAFFPLKDHTAFLLRECITFSFSTTGDNSSSHLRVYLRSSLLSMHFRATLCCSRSYSRRPKASILTTKCPTPSHSYYSSWTSHALGWLILHIWFEGQIAYGFADGFAAWCATSSCLSVSESDILHLERGFLRSLVPPLHTLPASPYTPAHLTVPSPLRKLPQQRPQPRLGSIFSV